MGKWACTEATYKMEKEDSASRETNDFNLIKMVQEMMSGKGWKNKPENKMFMKLFRYISGVNKEQEEDAGGRDGEQADVLLPQQEAPGQPPNSHRPCREDRAEQGVHRVCAHLRRLCHERLCQPEGGQEVCRGVEGRGGGGRHRPLLHCRL